MQNEASSLLFAPLIMSAEGMHAIRVFSAQDAVPMSQGMKKLVFSTYYWWKEAPCDWLDVSMVAGSRYCLSGYIQAKYSSTGKRSIIFFS